jgi:hypothetical protein
MKRVSVHLGKIKFHTVFLILMIGLLIIIVMIGCNRQTAAQSTNLSVAETTGSGAGVPGNQTSVGAVQTPMPSATPTPTISPVQTNRSRPSATLMPTSTPIPTIALPFMLEPTPTVGETITGDSADAYTPTEDTAIVNISAQALTSQPLIQTQTASGSQSAVQMQLATTGEGVIQPALAQVPDTDPGPPLTIEVTTNYAVPNPDLEGGLIYNVAGLVHNPSAETYAVTAVHVTFYDAEGFKGAFYPFPSKGGSRRSRPGGEWIWHGRTEADVGCMVIAPGGSCPFSVQIAAQDMASFLVHPDAEVATWREPASVMLGAVQVFDEGAGSVRISGTVINDNVFPIKNVVIAGFLIDANGQRVSMGEVYVLHIDVGASAPFDLWIARQSFVDYELYVQAEQDAK